jgi:hypothetical protein
MAKFILAPLYPDVKQFKRRKSGCGLPKGPPRIAVCSISLPHLRREIKAFPSKENSIAKSFSSDRKKVLKGLRKRSIHKLGNGWSVGKAQTVLIALLPAVFGVSQ